MVKYFALRQWLASLAMQGTFEKKLQPVQATTPWVKALRALDNALSKLQAL